MKTSTLTLVLFMLVLMFGAFLIPSLIATTIEINVEFDPNRIDLGAPPPVKFKVTIWFSGKYKSYKVTDIDRKTVLIGGILHPPPGKGLWKVVDNTVTFKVNSQQLIDLVILPKIYHMGRIDPNPDRGSQFPYRIDITVTGQLYDGTLFQGIGTIKVYTPQGYEFPPPNSPPI